ncbi:MAG: DNA polymerase domain-containing protein [Promethearchaeota archaeon]
MPEDRFWLLDAAYDAEDGHVQLTYLQTPAQKLHTVQADFAPYFYALPPSLGDPVRRKELMRDKFIEVARIPHTSRVHTEREWERDLNPELSFIYDQNLRFGSPHKQTKQGLQPNAPIPPDQLREFNNRFAQIAKEDPLKFDFLKEFFRYAIQPVPDLPRDLLNIDENFDESRILWGIMLARIANIHFSHALKSRRVSDWIRSMLHTTYRHLDILIPNPEELTLGHTPHRVEGALTIAPKPGTYYNMTVVDFESLYPSLIDRYNLSYETMDCQHDECKTNSVPDEPHYICTNRRGIFSALIGALKDLRIHWFKPLSRQKDLPKAERDQATTISDLLKLLLVSSGGVTIRIRGLASPPLAESMMAYGRWALRSSWDFAVEHGMRPIYGDTDSLFLDHPTAKQVKWLIAKVKDELKLLLSVDVVYPLCVFSSAKKAYFGILSDGTPDLKGITLGKSSTPPRFRQIFLEVAKPLAGVDTPKKLAKARTEIIEILQHQIAVLRRGEFTVEDLEYKVKVWKAEKDLKRGSGLAQPYQALQQLSDKGIKVKKREEIGFVKVKPFRYGSRTFSVKPTRMATRHEIDVPDYVRKLEMAFEQVLVPLQIEFPKKLSRGLDTFLSKTQHEPFSNDAGETDSSSIGNSKDQQKRLQDYVENYNFNDDD